MTGIGVQAMTARAGANSRRIKPGCFDEDVPCLVGDARVPSAHDACKPQRLGLVGNHEIVGHQGALAAIQQAELFASVRSAHHDAALNLVEVKDMGRLAHGKPAKVGDVYRSGDRLLFKSCEILRDLAG